MLLRLNGLIPGGNRIHKQEAPGAIPGAYILATVRSICTYEPPPSVATCCVMACETTSINGDMLPASAALNA